MNRQPYRSIITAVITLATLTVNGLANALPINGQNSGQISDRFDVYFTPAGYVFSIWGLIYIALIAYTIYQALPAKRDNQTLARIAPYYWLSGIANIAWIFLWHYEVFTLTIVAMLTLLASLVIIYRTLGIGRSAVSSGMKLAVHWTFSLYLGWITVATIANVTVLLWLSGWGGFGISPEAWTAIVLLIAVGIASAAAVTRGDVIYNLVLVWAFVGIAVKHPDVSLVSTSAFIAAAIVALLALLSVLPGAPLPLARYR